MNKLKRLYSYNEFLLEAKKIKVEDIKDEYLDKLNIKYPDKETESLFNELVNLDPSSKNIYTKWILDSYINKEVRGEDLDRYTNLLKQFMVLRGKLKDKSLKINNFNTLDDLRNKIQELQGSTNDVVDEDNSESWLVNDRSLVASKDVEVFHEDDENLVIKPLTLKGARFYSKCDEGVTYPVVKSNWCTVWSDNFKDYYPFYIIIRKSLLGTKDPKRRLQFAFGENGGKNDFMDINDQPISIELKEKFIYIFKPKVKLWRLLKYQYVYEFIDGLTQIKNEEDLFGFIDKEGKEVVEPKYKDVGDFREGLARVENKEGLWGFINKEGEEVVEPKYEWVDYFSEGLAPVENKEGLMGFINKGGREVVEPKYKDVWHFKEGLAPVENKEGSMGFINKEGKEVVKPKYKWVWNFKEGFARVKNKEGLMGIINEEGKEVVKPKYKWVWNFKKGLASVQNNEGLWGFVNKEGKEVVEPKYHDVGNFNEGLASVENKEDLWGFINKEGKEIIKPKYYLVDDFHDGLARVGDINGNEYYINKKGEKVNK